MNRREAGNYRHLMNTLEGLGFTPEESQGLIRIEKTLHRWCERECGSDHGCIERDEATGKPYWIDTAGTRVYAVADREKGALKRLEAILEARNARDIARSTFKPLSFYYQTDCRGCALYIIRPGDVREGSSVECCYTNGIAICY